MSRIRRGISWLKKSRLGSAARKKIAVDFAKSHGLIYFEQVEVYNRNMPIIRGSTASTDQVDMNYCIGTHADYDVAFVERLAGNGFGSYEKTWHDWYVIQIDLKHANNMPFIFVGTKQQTKAYYARLLTSHRQLQHLMLDTESTKSATFHSNYVVMASPAEVRHVAKLFDDRTIESVATYAYPFAVEVEGDSLMVITEALKPDQQLLEKLLHYGLWFAKEIDRKFG